MLSARFRTAFRHLARALSALVERGQDAANAAVAAVQALATDRRARLTGLMDRFEAGVLRPRTARTQASAPRRRAVRPAPLWPAHRPGWINMVGHNHPSLAVRRLWAGGGNHPAARADLQAFAASLREMVEREPAMRGLLEASAEARRLARWFLRSADPDKLPAILKEAPRARTPRERAPRARTPGVARPRTKRTPGPFETPPANLLWEERVARGLPVPPAVRIWDPGAFPWTPTDPNPRRRSWSDW